VIAEIGVDMSRSPASIISPAGRPVSGNNESAGKHKAGTTRKGDPWLRRRWWKRGPRGDPHEGQRARARYPARHAPPRAQEGGRGGGAAMLGRRIMSSAEGNDLSGSRTGYYDRRRPARPHAGPWSSSTAGYRVTLEPAA